MVAGSLTYDTKMDTSGFQKGINSITGKTQTAGSTIKSIIAGLGITKLITTAINTITGSLDSAISRIDTLNNFPKVMSNLGISTEESEKAVTKLSDGLQGIPTTLDDASLAVQRFTSANNDVNKSTDYFLAFNNALLAGGAATEVQSSALEQLSQAYAKGKPDAVEWRSILTAMPAQLKQVANSLGYTSTAVSGDFYNAIQNGTLSMDDFMQAFVDLNENGSGEFLSFAEQAKNATGGIQTSITNTKTAIVRGVADVITSINQGLQDANLPTIQEIITTIGTKAEQMLKKVGEKIPDIISKAVELYNAIQPYLPIIEALATAILAIVATIEIYNTIVSIATAVQTAFNTAMLANPIGIIILAIVALVAVFVVLWNKCEWFRNFWISLWNSILKILQPIFDSIVNVFKQAWELIKVVWDYVQPYFSYIFSQIMVAVNLVKDNIVNAFQLAWTIVQAVWDVVSAYFQAVFDTIAGIFEAVKDVFQGDFSGAWEAVKGIFASWENYFQTLWYSIVSIFSGVVTYFKNMFTNAWEAVKSAFSNFTSFFSNLFSDMSDVGNNIVQGLWKGISNAKDWLINKVKDFASGILDSMKEALGIHSPSTKFRDYVGKWIPKGIAVGIEANTSSVDKALDNLNDSMISKMQNAVTVETGKVNTSALIRSNANYNSLIKIENNLEGTVSMDKTKVGRLTAPSVAQTIKAGGLA